MKVIVNLSCLLLVLFIWGCSNTQSKNDWDNNESFVDSILNQISKQQNTTKRSEIIFLDSALEGKTLNLKQQLQVYAYKSGLFCYYLKKLDSAKLYADSMSFLLKDKHPDNYPNAFTYTYYTTGDALYANNQFNEAYTYYFKARQFNTTIKDYCTLKEYSYRIGMILYNQGKFNDAATNFKQSFSEVKLCEKNNEFSNYYRKQELLNNIALCYYKQDNTDSALNYYNNALDYIVAHQKADSSNFFYDEMAKGVVYGNIGDIYKKNSEINEAEKFYKKSISINLKSGRETTDAQLSYLKLAELYADSYEFIKLRAALADIRVSMNETPNPKAEIKWNKLSWKYYEQKNKAKAHDYLVRYLTLKEADEKLNKQIYEVDINKQLELLEKQNQLHLAQNENEVSRTYLTSTIVILILILLLTIILGRNWILSRKHITTLKELNETVNTQNEQLEKAMRALQTTISEKDSILKLVAHDLRTPVASIPTLVDIIETEVDESKKIEYLEMIKSACNSSLTLIAEIMATADISNKNIEKEPTLINEFINDCAAILELKVKEKNQQLIVQLPPKDITVMLNPEKMKRVVFNLVTNSIKFSKKGSSIILSAKKIDNKILIEVTDNGIGIPEKLVPEIFNISKSGKRKGTEGEKSYGLGLNICKRIVEAHDGLIKVKSQEDKGSTFIVELPMS